MNTLPANIEAYLKDANFSSTEMLILNRLLLHDALTLREVAAKTGKSTGVLDQAIKKLMEKNIVVLETINNTHKYSLRSLAPIMRWMEDDMKKKGEVLLRKHKDFEAFVHSLTLERKRPEMQYYEGTEGIKQAYKKLLELVPKTPSLSGKTGELLHYLPVTMKAEEDPLRDFHIAYFRERRGQGIFSRIVTHNTPLGRRHQSRDPFEYRKTVLVEESQYPFDFEKIIAGNTIACINMKENRACFIEYPELAKSERAMFEKLWAKKTAPPEQHAAVPSSGAPSHPPSSPATHVPEPVPMSTRTLSGLREFFLTRRSLVTFAVFGLIAAGLTYGLYQHNVFLNKERIRAKVLSIAATGALQFDAEDLDKLRTSEDIQKPEYAKVIYLLNEIRRQNEDVRYAYIMRPTERSNTLEFVADADSLDPSAKKDLNGDGKIDAADWLSPPGEPYDITDIPALQQTLAMGVPRADIEPYTDQWGTFISGHAPIKDKNGMLVAMLGVDIFASKIYDFTKDTFYPILTFLGLFLLFVVIRLAAFNRSLFNEVWEVFQMKKKVAIISLCGVFAIATTVGLYLYSIEINTERVREKVTAVAATAALQFKADELRLLHTLDDVHRPEYQEVTTRLNEIRNQNKEIIYVYIIRPTTQKGAFEFVADADAIDPFAMIDTNRDGKVTEADTLGTPGLEYDVTGMDALMEKRYSRPVANRKPYTDKWGTFITGYAPIRDDQGNVEVLIAVDMWADKVYELTNRTFSPIYVFIIFFVCFLLFKTAGYKKSLLYQVILILKNKKILITLGVCSVLAFVSTSILYFYTLHLLKDQLGDTLIQIAESGAKDIDVNDLNELRNEEDMKKREYQNVFEQLNEIRKGYNLIRYVYILRPTSNPNTWEFVVDADTNYYLPFLEWDYNSDGILDAADEAAPPGTKYDIEQASPEIFKHGLSQTTLSNLKDQWGNFLTAMSPIKNQNGTTVGVLGVDLEINDIYDFARKKYIKWLWFFSFFTIFVLIRFFRLK